MWPSVFADEQGVDALTAIKQVEAPFRVLIVVADWLVR